MTHPHNLDAIVAWYAVADARSWIAPTIEAEAETGRTNRYAPRLTAAAIARRGEVYAAARFQDRAARWASRHLTDTTKGLGETPAPVRAELLDAPTTAARAVREVEQLLAQAAAERDEGRHPHAGDTLRWQTIPGALADLDPWRAQTASAVLWAAAETIRTAVRRRRANEPYEASCPACDAYALVWETYADDPLLWTVRCDCVCRGDECPCGLPVRVVDATHRWEHGIMAPTSSGALSFAQVIEDIRAGRATWAAA